MSRTNREMEINHFSIAEMSAECMDFSDLMSRLIFSMTTLLKVSGDYSVNSMPSLSL